MQYYFIDDSYLIRFREIDFYMDWSMNNFLSLSLFFPFRKRMKEQRKYFLIQHVEIEYKIFILF